MWAGLKGGGLARSTNCGGVGFGKTMSGASYPTVSIWGSVDGGKRGMYRSTDTGASWLRVNDDAHHLGGPGNGQFIAGDMNTGGVVYLSTVGRGVVYGAPMVTP